MKEQIKKTLEAIGIAAGSVVAITGLTALLAWLSPLTPDDLIRFRDFSDGKYRVSVVRTYGITDLYFDVKGNKVMEHTYSTMGLINPSLDSAPNLADVAKAACADFPVGVELVRMLDSAREYQRNIRD